MVAPQIDRIVLVEYVFGKETGLRLMSNHYFQNVSFSCVGDFFKVVD